MGVCTGSTVDEPVWELVSVLAASISLKKKKLDHMETSCLKLWLMLIEKNHYLSILSRTFVLWLVTQTKLNFCLYIQSVKSPVKSLLALNQCTLCFLVNIKMSGRSN